MSKIRQFQQRVTSLPLGISPRGFSLIELMVAITLGILLSLGLVTLFIATSKTNRVQEAMAQMQENGRYAISRMSADLRMVAHQSQNVSGFVSITPNAATAPNGVVNPTIAADVYVANLALPDFASAGLSAPTGWPAATQWPLSQRYLMQGYECSTPPCSPLPTWTNPLPVPGLAAGNRVPTADVLTVRYLNADGWSISKGELKEVTSAPDTVACQGGGPLVSMTVTPAAGSAPLNFQSGDLAMLASSSSTQIFQVSVAGSTLTPTAANIATIPCFAQPTPTSAVSADTTLYNFSRDFITATYYLQLDADPNIPGHVIPALVRRQSNIAVPGTTATDQEIVQGVEQLDFLFGVQRSDGQVTYLTANNMAGQSTFANCPPVPSQYVHQLPGAAEPECIWRAVKSIEAHVLINSINNMYDLSTDDKAYQYTYGYTGNDAILSGKQAMLLSPAPTAALPSTLIAGSVLRREFVSLVSLRNFNP
jgi:type IV pilus assembly protein PilW